ncbi:MAG TPA: hypothetical protein VJ692_03400 [Nitrospiraceae bacterium]|nr:hypothetical protein [Nitrospiraceae bacterium]
MKSARGQWMAVAAIAGALCFAPIAGYADDFTKGSRAGEKGQIDKSNMGDRGQPGENDGGQVRKPGEGEQSGRPGTIFGAPATLPPADKAPQFEGAGKQKKKGQPPTAGGPE